MWHPVFQNARRVLVPDTPIRNVPNQLGELSLLRCHGTAFGLGSRGQSMPVTELLVSQSQVFYEV